ALPLRRAVDQRIDTVRPGGRCRQPNPRRLRGQAVTGQVSPRLAPVGRLIEAAAGPVRRRVSVPRRPSRLPQRGIDDLRVARLELGVAGSEGGGCNRSDRSDFDVVEDRLPRAARIVGAPDAAVDRAEIEALRIPWVTGDGKHPPAAERPDGTPFELLKLVRI